MAGGLELLGTPSGGGTGNASASGNATIVVAAADSALKARQSADFVCDGTTDTTKLAAAVAAVPAAGGLLALAEGTFLGSLAPSNRNNLTIRGAGAGTVLAPASGIALDIGHCSKIMVDGLAIGDGDTGLKVNGASLGRFRDLHVMSGISGDGVLIDGDSATETFFTDIFVKDVGGICWHYTRTTTDDTGGVYFTHCLGTKSSAGTNGWKFDSSAGSATKAFAWLSQCVCDGFGTDAGFIIDNVDDVRSEQMWVVAGSPGHPLVLLNNAHQIVFTDPRMYQNSATGTGVEFAGTTQYAKFRGGAIEGVGSAGLVFTGASINDVDIDRSTRISGWTAPTSGIVNSPTGVVAQHKPAGMSPTPTTLVAGAPAV